MANIPLKTIVFPGLDDTYTVPQIDDALTTAGKAADAKKTGDEISQIKAGLEDLDERVTAIEGGGDGLTDAVKTALMNLVNHIAWDDDDPTGQTYITALQNALYPPAPPASLTSITAVYAQSGTVYDTDTLNDLKSDLVVTAHYSDSTSHAVTDYTLSGTLAVGTSVIAVNYNGKSTTFSVTVTAIPYSFHEGIFTGDSSYTSIEIEVSGGHFHITNTAGKSRSMFIDEDSFGKSIQSGTMFSLSAGDEYEFKIKNIVFASNQNVNNSFTCTFRNPSDTNVCSVTVPYTQTTGGTLPDVSSTGTLETSTDVTCLKLVTPYSCEYEFDFEFWVNGERWI